MALEQSDSDKLRERAAESITGDPGLRDELTDAEAMPLIDWGVAQSVALAQRAARMESPEVLDDSLRNIRKIMKRINRLVGARVAGDLDGVRSNLDRLTHLSTKVYGEAIQPPNLPQVESFVAEQSALTNQQLIARLLAMFAPPLEPPDQITAPDSPDQLAPPPERDRLAAPPSPEKLSAPPRREQISAPPTPGQLAAPSMPGDSPDADYSSSTGEEHNQ